MSPPWCLGCTRSNALVDLGTGQQEVLGSDLSQFGNHPASPPPRRIPGDKAVMLPGRLRPPTFLSRAGKTSAAALLGELEGSARVGRDPGVGDKPFGVLGLDAFRGCLIWGGES